MTSALTDDQLRSIKGMLEERTGVQVAPGRDVYVRGLLQRRMQDLGQQDAGAYCAALQDGAPREWRVLLDGLLIKETQFCRHRPSLDFLKARVAGRLREKTETVTAWSAGCATGEEAYSIAMAVSQVLESGRHRARLAVIGSDVCVEALRVARMGVYDKRQLKQVTSREKSLYFVSQDRGNYAVAPSLKKRVCFVHHNILQASEAMFAKNVDIIFCQNVLIYFKRWQRRKIIESMARLLKPGGTLLLGVGEYTDPLPADLKRVADADVQAYIRAG